MNTPKLPQKKMKSFVDPRKKKENVNSTKDIFKIEEKQTKGENKDAFEIEVRNFLASDIPLEHNLSLSENEKIYEWGIGHKNLKLKEYIPFQDTEYPKYKNINDILTFFLQKVLLTIYLLKLIKVSKQQEHQQKA
ncbi:hypothetical protein CDIK_3221 [Cucumispora dikerogammari]|nr:hypothetical protein CDIK_3221 [Cucumispora dikerogammari]